jgi:hypothetical protein
LLQLRLELIAGLLSEVERLLRLHELLREDRLIPSERLLLRGKRLTGEDLLLAEEWLLLWLLLREERSLLLEHWLLLLEEVRLLLLGQAEGIRSECELLLRLRREGELLSRDSGRRSESRDDNEGEVAHAEVAEERCGGLLGE